MCTQRKAQQRFNPVPGVTDGRHQPSARARLVRTAVQRHNSSLACTDTVDSAQDSVTSFIRMFKCRSPTKILGLSVDGKIFQQYIRPSTILFLELARAKLRYHNYMTEGRSSGAPCSQETSQQRYERNRRRRLQKERTKQAADTAAPPATPTAPPAGAGAARCGGCGQELVPPYQVYVCHHGHLHTERGRGAGQVSTLLTQVISLTCPAAVLPRLLCSLTVQGAVHEGDGKKQEKVDNQRRICYCCTCETFILIIS